MIYKDTYMEWLNRADEETKRELLGLTEEYDIEDRFYKNLEFGTAGLRGIMGAGTNRMNRYTVAKATAGLAAYLKDKFQGELARGVVIAYDSRNHSKDFAKEAAAVLTAAAIPVRLFKELEPIPVLSFAVKHFSAIAGIVITASHNSSEYNGYKVYGPDGGQLVPKDADILTAYVAAVSDVFAVKDKLNEKYLTWLNQELVDLFIDTIYRQSYFKGNPPPLSIVYTPIHGSGCVPVQKVLRKAGFTDVHIVKEQERPDGNFPTVSAPNPENEDALALGVSLAKEVEADLVIGTDPDSDRVGCAVRGKDGFKLISGNQMGALLTYFLCLTRKEKLTPASTMVKTVVTGELGAEIAKSFSVQVVETLTGFKYIGEKISAWKEKTTHDFLLGYEESYGYLIGTHAQDKDAVVSAMMISEMAAYFQKEGKTLYDVLCDLYETYGFYYDKTTSYTLKGMEGLTKIQDIMKKLRQVDVTDIIPGISAVTDFVTGVGDLPKENVLKYTLKEGGWMAVRPSGTEPKIKIYYSLKGKNAADALQKFEDYKGKWERALGL